MITYMWKCLFRKYQKGISPESLLIEIQNQKEGNISEKSYNSNEDRS